MWKVIGSLVLLASNKDFYMDAKSRIETNTKDARQVDEILPAANGRLITFAFKKQEVEKRNVNNDEIDATCW